jgi:hypothetical protein
MAVQIDLVMRVRRVLLPLVVLLGLLVWVLPVAGATDRVTVNLASSVAPAARWGINVDYLTDDDRLRPPGAVSLGNALLTVQAP